MDANLRGSGLLVPKKEYLVDGYADEEELKNRLGRLDSMLAQAPEDLAKLETKSKKSTHRLREK